MSERIQDVNIELGDEVSKMLYEASKVTHDNRPGMLVEFHESFSGARAIPLGNIPDVQNVYANMGFDGIGTKVEVAERLADHSTVAFDLFAMVCDDAIVRGAEPVAIGSILDVRQLDDNEVTRQAVNELALGYIAAAEEAKVVVVNGEVAELGDRIGGYRPLDGYHPTHAYLIQKLSRLFHLSHNEGLNYNWGATVLWLAHKDRLLTGLQIKPGDALVGIREHGFRSNGITDVRKGLRQEYGRKWHETVVPSLGSLTLGELVRRPSEIYSGFVSELTGGANIDRPRIANITGAAHITGGGQPSKLGRMLEPSGLGADITAPLDPPALMQHVQKLRGFDDRTAYGKWHMGPGMILATPEPDKVLQHAQDRGKRAKIIGHVSIQPGIRIANRGAVQKEKVLEF